LPPELSVVSLSGNKVQNPWRSLAP
jgi:hypothetical protein